MPSALPPLSFEAQRIAATVKWADSVSATKSETAAFRAGWFAAIKAVDDTMRDMLAKKTP